MNLKKLYMLGYGVLALVALGVVGVLVYRAYAFDQSLKTSGEQLTNVAAPITATLKIDFGEGKEATYSAVVVSDSPTVLGLLNNVVAENKISVVTESKPLGVIIKSVNGLVAENGNFWLVYLNNSLVTDGLEAQPVATGDNVELRYNKL